MNISVEFEDTSFDLEDTSVCDSLPTVKIEEANIQLGELSFSRIHLVLYGSDSDLRGDFVHVTNLKSLRLSDSCIQLQQSSQDMLTTAHALRDIEIVHFSNWIYLNTPNMTLYFENCTQVAMSDGTTVISGSVKSSKFGFYFDLDRYSEEVSPESEQHAEMRSASIVNHNVVCRSASSISSPLFKADFSGVLSVRNFVIQNCLVDLNPYDGDLKPVIEIMNTALVQVEGLTFNNLNISSSDQDRDRGLILIQASTRVNISTLRLTNSVIGIGRLYVFMLDYYYEVLEAIRISDVNVSRVSFRNYAGFLRFQYDKYYFIGSSIVEFDHMRFTQVTMDEKARLFELTRKGPKDDYETLPDQNPPGSGDTNHLHHVVISNLDASNNVFAGGTFLRHDVWAADEVLSTFGIETLYLTNISLANTSFGAVNLNDGLVPAKFNFIHIYDVFSVNITNLTVIGIITDNSNPYFIVKMQYYYLDPANRTIVVHNLSVKDSSLQKTGILHFEDREVSSSRNLLETFEISNISLTNTTIENECSLMDISFAKVNSNDRQDTLSREPNVLVVRDVRITDSIINDTVLMSLHYAIPNNLLAVEVANCFFSDLYLANNTFTAKLGTKGLILLGGMFISFQDLVCEGNQLLNYAILASFQDFQSTFMKNMTFRGNQLTASQFISFSNKLTFFSQKESSYTVGDKLAAEFRPFVLTQSLFHNNTLRDSSRAITVNNPQIILKSNSFSNLVLASSVLISIVGYQHPFGTMSNVVQVRFTQAEQKLLTGLDTMKEVYDSAYTAMNRDWTSSEDLTYFRFVGNNTIRDIEVSESSILMRIHIGELRQSLSALVGNQVDSIDHTDANEMSLIYLSSLTEGLVTENKIRMAKLRGCVMHVDEYTGNLLFNGNKWLLIKNSAAYRVKSKVCGALSFQLEHMQDILTETAWISIECALLATSISFIDSSFTNLTIANNPSNKQDLIFMEVLAQQQSLSADGLILQGNTFDTLEINQGKKLIQNNALFLLTMDTSSVMMKGNTFRSTTTTEEISFMAIQSASLTMIGCRFDQVYYSGVTGAFNLILSGALVLDQVIFEGTKSAGDNGRGLFSFIEESPTSELVSIQMKDCVFRRNTAAISTILQVVHYTLELDVNNCTFEDNVVVHTAPIQLLRVADAQVNFTNSFYWLHSKSDVKNARYELLTMEESVGASHMLIQNSTMNIVGNFKGNLIALETNENTRLDISNFTYMLEVSDSETNKNDTNSSSSRHGPSFGLLAFDSAAVYIEGLVVRNISLGSALIKLICRRRSGNLSYGSLALWKSGFRDLTLSHSIVALDTEDLASTDMCPLSVNISSSDFKNIHSTAHGMLLNAAQPASGDATDDTPELIIKNNAFENITAKAGGSFRYKEYTTTLTAFTLTIRLMV